MKTPTLIIVICAVLCVLMAATAILFIFRLVKLRQRELNIKSMVELRLAGAKLTIPLKIQAYERFLLYLQRIQPSVLVNRVYEYGMDKSAFHLALIKNIREEFEHNLAQQLYVSHDTWICICNAREELVGQINAVFEKLPNESIEAVMQSLVALPNPYIDKAIEAVKKEFDKIS